MNEEERIKELNEGLLSQADEKVKITKWTKEWLQVLDDELNAHLNS